MKTRLILSVVAALVCSVPLIGAASPALAKSLLCEKSGCGGKGAYEWAEKRVEEHDSGVAAHTERCKKYNTNEEYVTQWACWGSVPAEGLYWQVNLDPYGHVTYGPYFCSTKEGC
jgi:hypothetical protein